MHIKLECFCRDCGQALSAEIRDADLDRLTVAVSFCTVCHEELKEEEKLLKRNKRFLSRCHLSDDWDENECTRDDY